MRSDLFHVSERYPVPISSFAIPSDISVFGSHFGDQSYYADFAGIAKKYAPREILEIGVRYGYSAVAMCLGAMAGHAEAQNGCFPAYEGIDACFFSLPSDPKISSNAVAEANFLRMLPHQLETRLYHCDTRYGLPEAVLCNTNVYDLINVDGDHSYEGCYRDLTNVWPLAAPGAIVIVDDTGMVEVARAVEHFRGECESKGELEGFQWHGNERGFALLLRK